MSNALHPANLSWRQGLPFAIDYDDTYFSVVDPEGERRYVFLERNDLPKRWCEPARFAIAETGFGTGLNLLLVMAAYAQTPWRQLTYATWERHPLSPEDLARCHALWPHLASHAQALAAVYPPLVTGVHHRSLPAYALELVFVFDDITAGLTPLPHPVDAWFLDGFAPSRNPSMWTEPLMAEIAAHTAPGGSATTYSAAGTVRRGLEAAGFTVTRTQGFRGKRHMTHAVLACRETQAL